MSKHHKIEVYGNFILQVYTKCITNRVCHLHITIAILNQKSPQCNRTHRFICSRTDRSVWNVKQKKMKRNLRSATHSHTEGIFWFSQLWNHKNSWPQNRNFNSLCDVYTPLMYPMNSEILTIPIVLPIHCTLRCDIVSSSFSNCKCFHSSSIFLQFSIAYSVFYCYFLMSLIFMRCILGLCVM